MSSERKDTVDISTEQESINLGDLLRRVYYHWPVFVLGVILCLGAAFLYLRYTEPIYEVSTTLLIKDQNRGGMPTSDVLADLDVFTGSKVVENEIEILKSKTLMRKVVHRLNLMVSFKVEGRVINSDIYDIKPVDFIAMDLDSAMYNKSWQLSFPNKTQYRLVGTNGKVIVGALNKVQNNILGVYRIQTNNMFDKVDLKPVTILISDPENVTNSCIGKLNIQITNKNSTVLRLIYNANVPKQGEDILNTLVQVYNEDGLSDKNRTTQSTLEFIDERLKLITGELSEVEGEVESFKSSQGLTNISSEADLFLDNVKSNDARLNEINIQIGVVNEIQNYVDSNSSLEKLPSTFGINDPVLLGQINQLRDLQLKKDQLLATTVPNNPLFDPINRQIETTREGIRAGIKNILISLTSTKAELLRNNSQYESSIKKIPGQERQFISIKRQQTIKESLYLYLLQKKEETALSYAASVADSRVVDPAYSSKAPIMPKRQLTIAMAVILGLILPAGYLYGKEILNNKVIGTADISAITRVPLLGDVVYNEGSEAIVATATSRKAIAEQFRAIRTNLQYVQGKRQLGRGYVTLLTSSMSGEGKSFIASNIAASLAISGKRTVLLELDLRKPKASKYLGIEKSGIGLSNYLIGSAGIDQILQSSALDPNLFVVSSGPIPPNPSELLVQKEMDELIEVLRKQFDEIIIDTAPIGLVTDAQVLARLADASIYVVRQGVTFKHQLNLVEKLRADQKFPKINIIFNGVNMDGGGYGYGYSYGYGYGYGYGYYSDDFQKTEFSLKRMYKKFLSRF